MFQLNYFLNGKNLGVVTLTSVESIEKWMDLKPWHFPEADVVTITTSNLKYMGYDGLVISKK